MPTSIVPDFNDSELTVLNAISEANSGGARLTQRELAGRAGVSLGMANILLKRLAERGWVKLTRLSAKSVRYALTPAGIGELAQRTAGYFNRASKSAELYRDRLEALAMNAKRDGVGTIVLFGSSEVEFLIAYVCERHGIVLVKSADLNKARQLASRRGGFLLIAEKEILPADAPGSAPIPGAPEERLALVLAGMDQASIGKERGER
jgi:DNA-binding MarR family transcriptional regulator